MDIGWNYRREHLPLEQRSHYVITDGGDQPNVVPRTASVWYYFRADDVSEDQGAVGRSATTIAKGAALMTGTELLPTRVLGTAWPQHFNKTVAETTLRQHPEGRHADSGATPIRRWPRRCRRSSASREQGL